MAVMTLRELQQEGLKALKNFMTLANSNDPLLAQALTSVQRALVLADTLNSKKEKTARGTAELKKVNEVLNEIRKYTPTGTDPKAAMTLPAKGKERTDLITRWKAAGIDNISEDSSPTQADSTAWQTILSTKSETISSGSQRDQLEMQTTLTRYNEQWELVSTMFKGVDSIGNLVTGNYR